MSCPTLSLMVSDRNSGCTSSSPLPGHDEFSAHLTYEDHITLIIQYEMYKVHLELLPQSPVKQSPQQPAWKQQYVAPLVNETQISHQHIMGTI